MRQQLALLVAIDRMNFLRDRFDGRVAARDFDQRRRLSSRPSASVLISSEKVAENSRFCRFGGSNLQHALDVVNEAHVEHAIGFVEHEDFEVRQIDGALLLHVVEQAARRGDDDIDAAAQCRRSAD